MTGEVPPPRPKPVPLPQTEASSSNGLLIAWRWIWARPFLIVLLAHSLFSLGIWNAQEGYDEESYNIINAHRIIESQEWSASLYLNLLALILSHLSSDPLTALTILKYISSLLATIAIWLTLRTFSNRLQLGSLLISCLLWIASAFHAPFLQSTSLSLFAFTTMLFGVVCVLHRWSPLGFSAFCVLGLLAAAMRYEYALPVGLIVLLGTGYAAWRWIPSLARQVRLYLLAASLLTGIATLAMLYAFPPKILRHKLAVMDYHALLGLGQCYAGFYHQRHPGEIFNPATEYPAVIDRVFNRPKGFSDAARNNPRELALYLSVNTARNLFTNLPKILLGRYREQSEKTRGWLYWAVRALLLAGAIAAARRVYQSGSCKEKLHRQIARGLRTEGSLSRSLILLTLLASAALPAIILLIALRRYYLPCVPLFFVGVAFCLDSLVKALKIERFQGLLVAVSVLCFCWPNYLVPRPNIEANIVRHVAPMVRPFPVLASWWADPAVILGLGGQGTGLGLAQGITEADITAGKIDVLMVDKNFRLSKAWADQRGFFESFENNPGKYGFEKLSGVPTGRFALYYRPAERRATPEAPSR